MKITVCIGSSCHIKGSRQMVERLQELIAEKRLKDQVELAGTISRACALRWTTFSSPLRRKRWMRSLRRTW